MNIREGSRRDIRRDWLRIFFTAVQFLTRLPVPGSMSGDMSDYAESLRRSTIFFPLVGGLIGLFTGLVIAAAGWPWPIGLAIVFGLIAEAVMTGGFHEDAVADFCDAFGGGWTRDDVLRILKDSRIGSFGVLGLGLLVAARVGAIVPLMAEPGRMIAALVASATIGRWAILAAMALVPPVADRESLARDVGRQIDRQGLLTGSALAVPGVLPILLFDPLRTLLAVALVVVALGWFCQYVDRKLGGVTGDCLGFLCFLCQVVVLLALAFRLAPIGGGG